MEGEEEETEYMDPCFFCNETLGKLIKGLFICEKCLTVQQEMAMSYYLKKSHLTPSFNQITDKLFLGNEDTARSPEILQGLNISHILICSKGSHKFFPTKYQYETLDLDDSITQELAPSFPKAFQFIKRSTGNCYVHCVAGISRSASIVIAYLMYSLKVSLLKAFKQVESKRKEINPNSGFMEQLKQFEKDLEKYQYSIDYLTSNA